MSQKSLYELMTELGIAQMPVWTVSTNQKLPLAPKPALQANFEEQTFHSWYAIASDPKNTLVTLDELVACKNAPKRYALYTNIDEQKIMVLDVETIYDTSYNYLIKKLPVIYGEMSKNGGAHFIVPIPDDILNDVNFQPLFMRSRVAFAQTKDAHSGVEIFFRNHYITFTQNQINTNHQNTDKELREFLTELLDIANTTIVNNEQHINIEDDIPTDALTLTRYVLSDRQKNAIRKAVRLNDNENESDREYQLIYNITRKVLYTINNNFRMRPLPINALIDPEAPHDPTIVTWIVLHFAYEFLEPRDKWDKMTTQTQNYIQYTCNKAVNYCMQNP